MKFFVTKGSRRRQDRVRRCQRRWNEPNAVPDLQRRGRRQPGQRPLVRGRRRRLTRLRRHRVDCQTGGEIFG